MNLPEMCETGLMPLGDSRGIFCVARVTPMPYNMGVRTVTGISENCSVQPCISNTGQSDMR